MLETISQLVRRAGGMDSRRRSRAVRTRVPLPSARAVDARILERLRWLRSDLDYYHEQDGIILLAWDPNKPRVHEARKLIVNGVDTLDTRLMEQGFSILGMFDDSAEWTGELYQHAERIMRATHRGVDAVHAERVLAVDGTRRDERHEAHIRDRITSESRSDHRILFRHRKTVSGSHIIPVR